MNILLSTFYLELYVRNHRLIYGRGSSIQNRGLIVFVPYVPLSQPQRSGTFGTDWDKKLLFLV